MQSKFIELREAAEEFAGGNTVEFEMYLALLTTDAEEGRLPCVKKWTEGQTSIPGGISFTRPPSEWRVLRTALQAWMETHSVFQLPKSDADSGEKLSKPLGRQEAQDSLILGELRSLGYDPAALPRNLPGKPGVKREVRSKLVGKNGLFPELGEQFDKSWERLRKLSDIADKH